MFPSLLGGLGVVLYLSLQGILSHMFYDEWFFWESSYTDMSIRQQILLTLHKEVTID